MTEEISVRDQLIGILRTKYKFNLRFIEDLDELIFSQDGAGATATLKDLFAFRLIPLADGVPMNEDGPRAEETEYDKARVMTQGLMDSGELNCCTIFKGTADEVAVRAYDQLARVGESNALIRMIYLGHLLKTKHVPYADVREELCNALQPDEWVDSIAAVPELFGELSAMFNQGDGSLETLKIASWLATVECDVKTRTALIGSAISRLNDGVGGGNRILSGMHIITIG